MEFERGQLVFSKAGRDKGLAFIIMSLEGEYLFLSDGDTRPVLKPKKKKIKHVSPTKHVDLALREAIEKNKHILDSDIKKAITGALSEGQGG